ncbi:uncharacterized protein K460DRAFT_350171 [Cucurbitaria berberidis CBS 394.84]|uniref:Gfd2/YDR514C-like C-terminal domain-containing protein n=1 Tax=Cucurbitaria berberidis CBS 394.84 TaxID=1168544 RepID=A0A9P4GR98_9PLEO|nr:uncharacterized protein K460DRAFT_350171 [Cucurbitaria berberidis CBS 394.84]KAF1850064.1 hypothetical protein K460DRAFT_350171 [Cucurbitaria berberidis CBS 394.84]
MPPSDLKSLLEAEQSRGLTHSAILQHWLRLQTIHFGNAAVAANHLRDAILVGLDVEWYEHNPEYITELGVSVLDPMFINDWSSLWEVLRMIVNHHVRIKPNAHMVNSELCHGYPEKYQFGKTTFVSTEEAASMLRHLFTRFNSFGQRRPVIFLGHAVDNDTKMIKERFGFDIDSLDVVVATLDTQILAVEAGLATPGRKMRLCDMLAKFNVVEAYLHNAGNDIVCTMIGALLMVYPSSPKDNAALYQGLKVYLQNWSKMSYGVPVFCTKCDSNSHVAAGCYAVVHCALCATLPHRRSNANMHKTEKCLELVKHAARQVAPSLPRLSPAPLNVCPCQYCIESPDRQRNKSGNAYSHTKETCPYK